MNDSINNAFKTLSELLKGDTPESINNLLNDFGVSKEDFLNKLNSVKQEDLLNKINSQEVDNALKNLSPEDIEKLKKANFDQDQVEELYKSFKKSKQGN